jgi:preprotein translocase subunit SecG
MWTLLTAIHVLACFFLIGVVLLQTGKGADVGAVFGGSSSTLFGSTGAGNFLTKLTTGIAILFMLTSVFLTYGSARQRSATIFDEAPITEPFSSDIPPPVQTTAEGQVEEQRPSLPDTESSVFPSRPAAQPEGQPTSDLEP